MNYYCLKRQETAFMYKKMCNTAVRRLLKSFCVFGNEILENPTDDLIFKIGETEKPRLPENAEFAIKVDGNGACVCSKDYGGLMRGLFALLLKFEYKNGLVQIKHTEDVSSYLIKNRMLHICVFPENDLYFIKKLIRFAALCQYTHIVIEFWGMLKFDCLKELSWPCAFTKNEASELICECRELGIEPIPMFNQLGHAAASRFRSGKHVVLDQNPALCELFSPDGWTWNIESEETVKLLKKVRLELYELFGNGEYIHIGCDEADYITRNERLRKKLPEYLKNLTNEVELEGRRPMLWFDMLLEEGKFKDCCATGKAGEVELLQASLSKSSVFVDWQYDCSSVPVPSLHSLKDCGHDCIGAPWFKPENYNAHIKTVISDNLHGIMLTTWHTLNDRMISILGCAIDCGAKTFVWSESSLLGGQTATLFRRISFEGNDYNSSGWEKKQIEV